MMFLPKPYKFVQNVSDSDDKAKGKCYMKFSIKRFLPTKRRIIQLYAALLFNANIKGFASGRIYKGNLKNICAPGLNCYSCPGASGACPLGSLQNSLFSSNQRLPYYVFGIILLYGLLFGRWICGFLCPFGLIQELFHKFKTPKLKKSKVTKVFSYFKYVLLIFFVVILPLIYSLQKFALPAFCKYICPAGTLEGAMGLLMHPDNSSVFDMLGPLFTWKFVLLVIFIVGSVFVYRFFCRFFCPLGAIYGFFNKISFIGVKLDVPSCTDCGKCITKCQMDITRVGDHECIACGECISACPTNAISWKGPKVLLRANEISENESSPEKTQKSKNKTLAVRITAWVTALAVLAGVLVYCNFFDKPVNPVTPPPAVDSTVDAPVGKEVGNACYSVDVEIIDSSEKFNVLNTRGKITVINFWGTWCGPCVQELPYFDTVSSKYSEQVSVFALHSDHDKQTAKKFVDSTYPESNITFCIDNDNVLFNLLIGGDMFPATVILDQNGIIVFTANRSLTLKELEEVIKPLIEE